MMQENQKSSWLERSFTPHLPWLTIEVAIFGMIVLVAAITRLYNLGARVMSHDESLHTYFSWLLYNGGGYQHNPMMHGPLQFHLLALTYFLFGVSDFTARLPHAIASIFTIIMLWKWRRYLGRAGALIAAVLAVISPYLLYYGRYARNEAFVGLVGILSLYAVLRYLETGQNKYLYLLTAATVLHFTIKETAFIYAAQTLLFLLVFFISKVTRAPWKNITLYRAFLTALTIGILLFGSAAGALFLEKSSNTLSTYETAAPQVPGQTTSPLLGPQNQLSLPVILLVASVFVFIIAGILLIYGYGLTSIRTERSFDMLMLLGTLVLPQLVAFPIKLIGKLVNPANGWNPLDYGFQTSLTLSAAIKNGALSSYFSEFFNQGLVHTALVLIPVAILSILLGLWWNKKQWLLNAGIWYVIFTLFYTTFFTNGQGFFTGMVGSLGYWLEQQGVNRGSQPWYYYILVQIPMYEFLPAAGVILAMFFGLRRKSPAPLPPHSSDDQKIQNTENPNSGTQAFVLMAWWAASSLLAFTIAGEKMPWLTYHITLPFILLTAWGLGQVVERMDWEYFRRKQGGILVGLSIISFISLGGLLVNLLGSTPPFQGKELAELSSTAGFLFSIIVLGGSVAGIIYLLIHGQWPWKHVLRVAILGLFFILGVLTTKDAVRAAYIHYDDATEYLVYAHGARGIKDIMDQVSEISRRTVGENNIIVAYDVSAPDTGVSWPFTWYLRDYPNTRPFDQPTKALRDASVIIVDQKNFDKILPVVGDAYYRFDYIRMVWPNQDYFGLTWKSIMSDLSNPGIRQGIFDIWLNRDYTQYSEAKAGLANNAYFNQAAYQIATWEPADQMRFYVRKDVAAQIWNYGVGPTTSSVTEDPYDKKMLVLIPDLTFGTTGQGDGQLNDPHGIAAAPDGTIYIADTNNNRVVHFSAEGHYINSWGSFADATLGPAALDTFNQPWGVAVSPDGQWVYVTDTWNHRIVKYTTNGIPIKAWGFGQYGGSDPYGLWGPRGITVDMNGNVFVTDTGNKRVVAYTSEGDYLGQIGTEGLEPGQFSEPVGLAFDPQGNLFIDDTWNQRIQAFAVMTGPDGKLSFANITQWDVAGWYGQALENKPYLAIDNQGNIYTTDPNSSRVLVFTSSGDFIHGWGMDENGDVIAGIASGITIDSQGSIWVSDALDGRIFRFILP